jgi:diguanylate cyclase (GGDEF)-like protein
LIEFVRRYGRTACVAIIDIDLFKRINDRHGHDAGDKVLHTISGIMTQKMRGTDLLARIGGEEFGMLMPESEPGGAIFGLERLRDNVRNSPILLPDGTEVTITVSIGLAGIEEDDATRQCIKAADDALFAAKGSGRDRICRADELTARPAMVGQSAE